MCFKVTKEVKQNWTQVASLCNSFTAVEGFRELIAYGDSSSCFSIHIVLESFLLILKYDSRLVKYDSSLGFTESNALAMSTKHTERLLFPLK